MKSRKREDKYAKTKKVGTFYFRLFFSYFPPIFPLFFRLPRGPKDRKNSFSLDRLKKPFPHARKNHSRLKISFLVRKFHSRLKISIPGPVFLQPGRGQIEKTILDRKFHSEIEILNFSISHLEIEFFQSLGPLGICPPIFWIRLAWKIPGEGLFRNHLVTISTAVLFWGRAASGPFLENISFPLTINTKIFAIQKKSHLFLRILFSFFALSTPPFPQAIFFPKIPSFLDLRSTLSSREKATWRGWILGTVLDKVAPQEEKENPFFLAREKKVRNPARN